MRFEIKDRDAAGRLGKLTTSHGTVITPTLLPVINPNKLIITPREMQHDFDIEMVITNSYIIKKHEDLRQHALEKGVHDLLDFHGPVMTDSGTFQSYIYGSVTVKPLEIIEFQKQIGVDVGTILDVFSTPDQTKSQAKEGMVETIKRARKSVTRKGDMGLACTVQGSIYPELRTLCAKKLSSIDADLYPIGGVVPLMEQQRYAELVTIILASKMGLRHGKPVHLFGAGHPLIFPLAVALGCDIFDSSAYVKYAQEDRLIFPEGTMHLSDIDEFFCCCPACSKTSVSEVKQMTRDDRVELIARHNLWISIQEIKRIRHAIRTNMLWELVEQRASRNPWLLDSLQVLRKKRVKEWLELFEPIHKKKALIYTGPQTIHRPLIHRVMNRLIEWYQPPSDIVIVLSEVEKPYHIHYAKDIRKIIKKNPDVEIIVDSAMGPVPITLDEMYPFAQSVFPHYVDKTTKLIAKRFLRRFLDGKTVIYWKDEESIHQIPSSEEKQKEIIDDIQRVNAIANMQFGRQSDDILFHGKICFVKSKKTKKIRNVYSNDSHVVSLRASDGLFTLKLEGGRRLHNHSTSPRFRVIIDDDAVEFVKDGKSVFSKFVVDADPLLRPFDECLVVDTSDCFLGVGRCLLNKQEMKDFSYGQAVKIREHVS